MLPFPEPRPTGPPPSPYRASPDSVYGTPSPGHSSFDKTLPPLPPQLQNQHRHSQPVQSSQRDSESSERKGGFKWWWKGGARRETERRKSLGIGSSRTSYHVDDLASGLQGINLGACGQVGADPAPDRHHGGIAPAQIDYSGRKRTPPPPPIPPRPVSFAETPVVMAGYSSQPLRTGPTKLFRKCDPPPVQVPVYSADLFSSQQQPSGHRISAPLPHSYSQPALCQPQVPREHSPPSFKHSHTTSEIAPRVSGPSSHSALPPQSLPTWSGYNPSALSPTHRDNLVTSARYQSPPSTNHPSKYASTVAPATPISKRTDTFHLGTPTSTASTPARNGVTGASRQCSGFTRQGRRCKRMVKTAAPYAALIDGRLEFINKPPFSPGSPPSRRSGSRDTDDVPVEEEPRYCRDHVKQICEAEGFYWKGQRGEKWIRFADWIPDELEEQSKVLLRLTMESALTNRECEGYIYAYELRDLQTSTIAYYKVGRTDNVPRRLDEWKKRCVSHHPTLRDVFPLHDEGPGQSMLPGAMGGGIGTNGTGRPTCPAVKRLERLIHIELAAYAAQSMGNQAGRRRYDCPDCQTSHQEIFPITRSLKAGQQSDAAGWEYERVVKAAIARWEAYIRDIMA